jgi:hypothetical protein
MSTVVTWNGGSFTVPSVSEENWGGVTKVDGLLVSLATNGFQKTGGTFTLSADADFGAAAGLKSIYYKSRHATPATAGILRVGVSESFGWRNNANDGNLLLSVNASDQLLYNGSIVIGMSPSLTINRALVSDGTGQIISATTTATEIGYVNGVTSAIQTQLNTKITASSSDVLTNKKLSDSTCTIVDNGDNSKQLAFECSGISASTTRTWTVPNVSDTLTGIAAAQTLTTKTISASENTLSHLDFADTIKNLVVTTSNNGTVLTVSLQTSAGATPSATDKCFIAFRNSTATSGLYVVRTVASATSISISTSMGFTSGTSNYLYVYAIDNAGTVELAASASRLFDENSLQTTTAVASGTDRFTLYSTTARSNVGVRLIGRILFSLTTAGTWNENGDEISNVREPVVDRSEIVLTTANGHGSGSTRIRRFTTTEKSVGTSISYPGDSSTLGSVLTIMKDGVYCVWESGESRAAGGVVAGASINSNELTTGIDSIAIATVLTYCQNAAAEPLAFSITRRFVVGDVIRFHTIGTPDGTTRVRAGVCRVGD